jgi:hypothetical protein
VTAPFDLLQAECIALATRAKARPEPGDPVVAGTLA